MTGYVHSIYAGGMVDGPGIRSVVFLSGCPLRCKYCHNPDTWSKNSGKPMTVDECLTEILKYKSYFRFSGGGVTIAGGEPLSQPEFLIELLDACRAKGIHTAVDTSGYTSIKTAEKVLPHTDLLILDLKAFNPQTYKKVTGVEIDKTIDFLNVSKRLNIPTWVHFVLVPNLTDDLNELKQMAEFLKDFDNIEKIDVLPFHKNGEYKWEGHSTPYELANTQVPTKAQVEEAQRILKRS